MAFPLTPEQKKIVEDRGGELLVSAAAGSGKTRVLVERLLDRVTGEGLDIDQFLVITYTKAAAAELRTRIAQELTQRLAQHPHDRHLRRQTTLVYQAQISTIHSFCAALLRENGHLLDLDPDARLCDEGESAVMMARVLGEVMDRQYEGLSPQEDFAALVDTMAAGRDDSRLEQIVLDIFGRVQSHPDPARWLLEQRNLWELEGVEDAGQTPWGALLLEEALRQGSYCLERLGAALELTGLDPLLEENYAPSLSASIQGLRDFLAGAEQGWDRAAACLPIPFPAAGRRKKRAVEFSPMEEARAMEGAGRLKAIRERCKKQLGKLAEQFEGDSARLLEDLRSTRGAVRGLVDLVLEFQRAYQEEKHRRGVLDFSDLEHFAVALLTGPDGGPTPLAHYWSARLAEVMVDEYQDTNQVQNAIFSAISQGGRKLFLVGDVKQSIYRFRLADPTIFLDKYRRFPEGDGAAEGEGRKRVLSRNFRSRPQVLEGCNDLFRAVMSAQFGELDYSGDQALYPGAKFPQGAGYATELSLLDLSFLGDREGERPDKDLLEARYAARRVAQLLEEPLMISQGEGLRPLRPGDVMILLRSPGSVLHHYVRALNEAGIPWSADSGEDFFATTEVNVALALLQIVDNPRQDVALIAALRSPVYGFDGDKLALLRARAQGDFYSAVVQGAEGGDGDCAAFLEELEQLRFGAGDKTCRQLIWHIYQRANLLGLFGAMEGGRERQNNLLTLYALAGQMEQSGCRSLFQFLLRLERLRASGARLSAVGAPREGEGVSIMSVHRSKGLERPVVLVCGLSRRLNRDDLMRPVLFHPRLGIGPKGLDRERMVEYPTLARQAVARQLEREMMAEELRLLYVAMTRAREKLILVHSLTDGVRGLERLGEDLSVPPAPMTLEQQTSVGAWVLLHALTRPEARGLREMAGLPQIQAEGLGPPWDLMWVEGESLSQPPRIEGRLSDPPCGEEGDTADLLERLSWQYPHQAAAGAPSKLTATQLKGRELDQEAAQQAQQLGKRPPAPISRPDFVARERGLTAAQRGTALHLAMQYLPLEGDHSPQAIAKEVERLVEGGFLTRLQGDAVQPQRLAAFFQSRVGLALLAAGERRREFKFSILVPAQDYCPGAEGEEMLLQGVIDCWFASGDEVTVLDFKSDRVRPGEERERAREYRPQLQAYSRALEEMLGRRVGHRVLWFFATDTAVEL